MQDKKRYVKYYKYDLLYADLGKTVGTLQGGIRPVMVISSDYANAENSSQLTVIPMTTKMKNLAVHVLIAPEDIKGYRTNKKSMLLVEQIQTIHKGQIRAKIGYASKETGIRSAVDSAVRKYFGMEGDTDV